MNFVKKKIIPKIIGIIDIGTYKVRVAITKYKNRDLELLGYGEKRQDCSIESCHNVEILGENINDGIKKAENDAGKKINEIIINIPFEEIFFESSKINYIRKNTDNDIDKKELNEIINEIKEICLKKSFKNIKQNYSYKKDDLKLIISNINGILLDKKESKKILHTNPKEINISILNIFIPRSKFEIIKSIGRITNKKIYKILPSEYSLTKLPFSKKNFIIIDLGKSYTSILIKKKEKILGVKKIAVGINDLIKDICIKYKKRKIEVINTINDDLYTEEKNNFLNIFRDVLVISIEEIIGDDICPHNIFMIGGGSNKFIRNHLQEIDFNTYNIKMTKKLNFITPNIEYFSDIESSKSNLNIYSMMKGSLDFIKRQRNPLEDTLKEAMSKY